MPARQPLEMPSRYRFHSTRPGGLSKGGQCPRREAACSSLQLRGSVDDLVARQLACASRRPSRSRRVIDYMSHLNDAYFTGHRADDLPAHLVIVIVGHVLVPVILWVRGRLCTVASVSAWHLPSDCGLGLDSSPAAGQGRRRGAAMVAQDARLRRASARRTPGLRRKVRQRNGAREVGASASNFICAYPLNLFRVAKASAWCRASRPHLTSSHRRSAE